MSSLEGISAKERAFVEFARRAFGDPVEAPAFLLSFKNFAAGLNLFHLWVQEFERVRNQPVQRTRLLEFLHCWMSAYPTDLASREHKRILALLSTLEHQDETVISEFKRLISLENTTKLKRLISRQAQSSSTSPSTSPSTSSEDVKSSNASPPGSAIIASQPQGFPGAAGTTSQTLSPGPKAGRQRGASVRNWLQRGRKNTGDQREMASISSPAGEGRDGAGRTAQVSDSPSAMLREETDFLAQGSIDIARELTMIEFEIFKNIGSRELLNQCWQKENKSVTAPFITKLIAKFNEVSYWVATEILSRADPREQARVITKFIKIARLCYQLYNFNSLSEILTGLNNSAVIRLKVAWMCVPDRSMRQFQQLDQLMQPQANYLHYRQEIRRLTFTKRDRRPTTNVPTPSGLSTVSSDSALQTSLSHDEFIPSSARGPQPTEPPTLPHPLSLSSSTTPLAAPPKFNSSPERPLPTSTSASALPTATSSSSLVTSTSTSSIPPAATTLSLSLPLSSATTAAVELLPLSPSSRSRLTDFAIDHSAPAFRPTTPEPQVGDDATGPSPNPSPSPQLPTTSPPVVKRVANLRDNGSGSSGEGSVVTQDRTSFLPRAPLSPQSPRSQWTVEIGLSRDRDRDRDPSPRSDKANAAAAATPTITATKSQGGEENESDGKAKESAKAKQKATKTKETEREGVRRVSSGDALPRQEALHLINTDRAGQADMSAALAEKASQEGKDKYFLTELGASTRALVGDRALPVLSLPPPGSGLSGSGPSVPSSPSPSLALLSSSVSLASLASHSSSLSSSSASSPFSTSSPFSASSAGSSNVFVARGIPPILPYLAIILRDFIAVSEGNAAYTPEGWINSHLIDLQYQIVGELKNFQANSYSLPRKESTRRYLETLQYEDDDDILYSMSLKSCPIAQPLEGMPHGESSINPDTAQEYFEAAMNNETAVAEVLRKDDCSSSSTATMQPPRPTVRERNASIAFYAMLSQGTAGMLEREMGHLKLHDSSHSSTSPSPLSSSLSRKLSTSGGSCIVFRERAADPWNTEAGLSSASESDSQPFEVSTPDTSDRDEREGSLIIGGSGVHESLSSALVGVAAGGGHSKGRPKSLQPWSSGELDVAGGSSSLRDRSNSATTEQQKQHDDEQNRRRLGQLQKKSNAKNNSGSGSGKRVHHARGRHKNERTGSFDDTTLRAGGGTDFDDDEDDYDDDIDVIRERPAPVVEESSDDDQRAALAGSRAAFHSGGAKRVKSLKQLKERILSFRGKVDLGSSGGGSGGSGDGISQHHHQRSNSTGNPSSTSPTTLPPSPTSQSTSRDQSSSTNGASPTTSSTPLPAPLAAAGSGDMALTSKAESADTAQPNNNNNNSTNQTAATNKEGKTKTMRKKKRKKQGGKVKAPADEAQGTSDSPGQATMPPPAQLPPVVNRPAVVTRDRQGSVAFYATLGQGASVLLAASVYKPST